ncbi:MAG: bifunctional (p)ppGpp synthetase/guanosine-3',5'-bis(diphosphate) 3'-pyrophosphohydrolase [Anaerolinea sp.]|nr:bifunctional (p)ppGpp synthetase/guanosine-3',5'-bis(diphosphate) 3'-pyrophosphohydrolase [Anaerolinea sp.]MCC6975607.1 bifunctional (p)ppGpp synthetase/guanosine-3',5'-bis(diphosphate) 3'-pyrophosphohydrolase [Anaerolineae bacterium]CAG0949995.1 GTP pyrophosphokinase [Anaerolineae bacterium]
MTSSGEVYPPELDKLFKNVPRLTAVDRQFVLKAYERAAEAHKGGVRASGEPYITHPVAVAFILSELKLDAPTLAAALLHDVVEDCDIPIEVIENEFGLEVSRLVDGVTKLEKLPTNTENMKGGKAGDREAETLRKIFLAMGNDIRVVLIKLADRLHNMRTLGFLSLERQRRMAKETMDIFAPLANRLGMWQMKWELEDLSFRYLEPESYKEIATYLNERRTDRERSMEQVKARLQHALAENSIQATISARPKHIYSIFRKMERKKVRFSEVYDVRAVRVIVNDKNTCYQVLGIVHNLWRPIPAEFDDYIASPKDNFYQSLHTAVIDETGKNLEIQIRTWEMHEHAEYGVAAHWRYKEGTARDEEFEKRLRHLRKLMDFSDDHEAQEDPVAYLDAMKSDVFQNRVYVFSPKGDIFDLPAGSTPIDFAYHIHTEIGNRCRGARVNGAQVGLDYQLKSGDRVEIINTKRGGPSLDWLNPNLGYVHTSRARGKIKTYFKKQDYDKNVVMGREVVDRELKRLGVASMPRETVAEMFNFTKVDDFLSAVGSGDITGAQIATKILDAERKASLENPPDMLLPTAEPLRHPVQDSEGIDVMGNSGMLINLARCCNPVRGDEIVGYVTRGRGVTVHRTDCSSLRSGMEPERMVPVNWGKANGRTYPVPVIILAYDREGLMRDVGAVIADENINMNNVSITTRNSVATFLLTMEMQDVSHISRVLARIEQLPNVIEARRRT